MAQDYETAFYWLVKASDQGNSLAAEMLGSLPGKATFTLWYEKDGYGGYRQAKAPPGAPPREHSYAPLERAAQ